MKLGVCVWRGMAFLTLLFAIAASGCSGPDGENGGYTTPSESEAEQSGVVILHTTMGDITIELYEDMPETAGNFKELVGKGFYDNVTFHRVIDGFMVQGGDPTGTGAGGPGYFIADEFTPHNNNSRGTIAMANKGIPNTGGSQFFINVADNNRLDNMHPVFGKVTAGMDVVDAISKVETGINDQPLSAVMILSAELV